MGNDEDDFTGGRTSTSSNPTPPPQDGDREVRRIDRGLASLQSEVAEYKKSTPTYQQMQAEITGVKRDFNLQVEGVGRQCSSATREALDRCEKAYVPRESFTSLVAEVERNKPPGLWKIVVVTMAAVASFGGIVWNASSRASDLALQNALLQRDVGALREAQSRVEARVQQVEARVDRVETRRPAP